MKEANKKFALFWGCLITTRLPWIEVAARKVLPKLGIEIIDLAFSCCPDPIVTKSLNHKTWLTLAARNITLAETHKLDILTLCSGCFETLKMAKHELCDASLRDEINSILLPYGREYIGNAEVFHLNNWLYNEFGVERLEKFVTNPLQARVATHAGCHFSRPADIMQTDDPIYPEQLDELCDILGLEPVDYPDKNLCCGVGVGLTDRQISMNLIQRKIVGARRTGSEALIAQCPSCIQSYEFGQVRSNTGISHSTPALPIFHFLEVLGLAMGIDRGEFAFQEHHIPVPENVLR
jgi:heterodisulfide reductase subunit B